MLGFHIISETLVVYVAAAFCCLLCLSRKPTEIGEIPSVWVDLWSGSTCCPRPIGPPILPLLGIGWRSINSLLLFKSLSLLLIGQESSTRSVKKGLVYNSLSEQHKNTYRSLSCIIIKVWYNQGTKLGFKAHHFIIAAFTLHRPHWKQIAAAFQSILDVFEWILQIRKAFFVILYFHSFSCFKISSTWSRRLTTRELPRNVDHW